MIPRAQHTPAKTQWDHIVELREERGRLKAINSDLLVALKLYRKARETGDYTNADEASLDAIVAAQGGAR